MSNHLLNAAWKVRGLTPAEKVILVRLADRASKIGHCFPGHESIAEDCGLSERTVRDSLTAIAAKGHISIASTGRRTGRGASRFIYTVHPIAPENNSPVTPETFSPVTLENGALDTGNSALPHRKMAQLPYIYNHHSNPNNNPKGNGIPSIVPQLSASERISAEKELETVRENKKRIRDSYDSHQTWAKNDMAEFQKLKARENKLKQTLGREY